MAPRRGRGSLSVEEIPEFYVDEHVGARLSTCPATEGDTVVEVKHEGDLSSLNRNDSIDTILAAKRAAMVLKKATEMQRVALVTVGDKHLRLIPLHGLSSQWKPVTNAEEEYNERFPGYIHSRTDPNSRERG